MRILRPTKAQKKSHAVSFSTSLSPLVYSINVNYKVYATDSQISSIQWNSVNKSTSGQPVLDLIRGGFNKRRFLKCTRRFRSKQIGCNKRLDLLTVDLLTEFHCIYSRMGPTIRPLLEGMFSLLMKNNCPPRTLKNAQMSSFLAF